MPICSGIKSSESSARPSAEHVYASGDVCAPNNFWTFWSARRRARSSRALLPSPTGDIALRDIGAEDALLIAGFLESRSPLSSVDSNRTRELFLGRSSPSGDSSAAPSPPPPSPRPSASPAGPGASEVSSGRFCSAVLTASVSDGDLNRCSSSILSGVAHACSAASAIRWLARA